MAQLYVDLQTNKYNDPVRVKYDCDYYTSRNGTTISVAVHLWGYMRTATAGYPASFDASGGTQNIYAYALDYPHNSTAGKNIKTGKWANQTHYDWIYDGIHPAVPPGENGEGGNGTWHSTNNGVKYRSFQFDVYNVPATVNAIRLRTMVDSTYGSSAIGIFTNDSWISVPVAAAPSGVTISVSPDAASPYATLNAKLSVASAGDYGGVLTAHGIQVWTSAHNWRTLTTGTSIDFRPIDKEIGYNTYAAYRSYATNQAGLTTYSGEVQRTTSAQPAVPSITFSANIVATPSTSVTVTLSASGAASYLVYINNKLAHNRLNGNMFSFTPSSYDVGVGGSFTVSATAYSAYGDTSASAGSRTGYVAQAPYVGTITAINPTAPMVGDAITYTYKNNGIPGNSGNISSYAIRYRYYNSQTGSWSGYTTATTTETTFTVPAEYTAARGANDRIEFSVAVTSNYSLTSAYAVNTVTLTAAKAYVKVSNAWKKGDVWIKQNGAWSLARGIYTKLSDTWRQGL